jgi:EAL domain-containing protein (putative c-di-GMP-specific phosphodiesterase class I)
MARALSLKVVAEGVETQAQADFLRDHGCDILRGYVLGYPMAPAALVSYVQARSFSGGKIVCSKPD